MSDQANTEMDKVPTGAWGKFCKKFWVIYDTVTKYLAYVAGVGLFIISFVIVADVISRYALSKPFSQTTPFAELVLVLLLAFGGPWLLKTQGFITVDIVVDLMPVRVKMLLKGITYILSGILFVTIGWFAATKTMELIRTKAIIINSGGNWLHAIYAVPMTIFYFMIMIQYFRLGVETLARWKSGGPPKADAAEV